MAIRSLWNVCYRRFTTTSSLDIFYKGTIKKIDKQREDLVETLEKTSREVFQVAENNSLERQKEKGRETIEDAIFIYLQRQGKTRRGHVEFIMSALDKLKDYKVERDLDVYKSLFRIFPEKKMIAKGVWQSEFMHFPKQQDCAMDILVAMESNGVVPDDEFGRMILATFGMESLVMTKYQRMMYWMPKMRHTNPWPVPYTVPADPRKASELALTRLAVDSLTEVSVHETKLIPGAAVDTFIATSQSPGQRELLANHDKSKPLHVEGPITSWFRDRKMAYFVLRADRDDEYWHKWLEHKKYLEDTKFSFTHDTFKWYNFIEREEVDQFRTPTIHEQEDGVIYAVAMIGEDNMESLSAWLKILSVDNPALHDMSVVFNVKFPSEATDAIEEEEKTEMKKLPS